MLKLKNKFVTLLLALFILMAGSGICSAVEIVVHSGESIQAAIDNASKGDTILVEPGTYNEDLDMMDKNLILLSKSGSSNTIINGSVSVGPFTNIIIDGFTFKDRDGSTYSGINVDQSNCNIKNCKLMNYVTAILAYDIGYVTASNNQFIKCGTGIAEIQFSSIFVQNNKFIDCDVAIGEVGRESTIDAKNNVEIHTDSSGKQVVTPIPDKKIGYPAEPPANNTTNNTTPEQPTAPSNNTTVPLETQTENTGSSSSGSSGGSSHSSGSSGGGGTGGSPEPQKNVASKDTTKVFVPNEKQVCFNFPNGVTVVESISFTSKKTMGKITAITEDLKNKSTLVSDLPKGKIYKSFNVWVGNAGYGESDNILNATLTFKVEKSWLDGQNVDSEFIVLYKYNEKSKEWAEISTVITDEDDRYVYFTAEVPGYSSFVIAGKAANTQLAEEPAEEPVGGEIRSTGNGTVKGSPKESPGFGLISGIVCLVCAIFYRRR